MKTCPHCRRPMVMPTSDASDDHIRRFIADSFELGATSRTDTTTAYEAYARWANATGTYALPRKRWVERMAAAGYPSVKLGGRMVLLGIRVKPEPSADHFGPPEL